jgi:Flp pilus assembly pilin Flp
VVKIGRFELRAVENTRWDYIVPVGLSGGIILLWALVMWIFSYDVYTGRQLMQIQDWVRYFTFSGVSVILMFLITMFLTRLQRIFVFPLLGVIGLWAPGLGLIGVGLIGVGYTFGTLLLYLKYDVIGKNLIGSEIKYAFIFGAAGVLFGIISPFIALATISIFTPFMLPAYTGDIFAKLLPDNWALVFNIILWSTIFATAGVLIVRIKKKENSQN